MTPDTARIIMKTIVRIIIVLFFFSLNSSSFAAVRLNLGEPRFNPEPSAEISSDSQFVRIGDKYYVADPNMTIEKVGAAMDKKVVVGVEIKDEPNCGYSPIGGAVLLGIIVVILIALGRLIHPH